MESDQNVSRNEPCPCGSGKKYKRCHGVGASPQLSVPKNAGAAPGSLGGLGGFDPAQMDPKVLGQFTQALQRLPAGQMQRLQSLMQKAMAGKDVTREAEEFERSLPSDFKSLIQSMAPAMSPVSGTSVEASDINQNLPQQDMNNPEMNIEDAKSIVRKALKEGKITREEADKLLGGQE